MTLDSEQQRAMLMQLINASQVPGNAVEHIAALKAAVQKADIQQLPKAG